MKIGNLSGQSLMWYLKSTLLLVSLIWVIFMMRQSQVQSSMEHRDYQQFDIRSSRNHGLVYMKKMTEMVNASANLQYFDLFYFGMKLQAGCDSTEASRAPILIFAANFKEVSESYLSFYKEIENMGLRCPPPVYSLKGRDHLLTNSRALIQAYVQELSATINFFIKRSQHELSILTYEEGSVMMLKALQSLQVATISKISKIVFINPFNFNLKFLYEPSHRFIEEVKQRITSDPVRLAALNQTRLIFINTHRYWDPSTEERSSEPDAGQKEQSYYRLVFLDGQCILNSTVFIESRLMKNVFSLIENYEYFTLGSFTYPVSRFFVLDAEAKLSSKEIEYFFYYGELFGRVDHSLNRQKAENCRNFKLLLGMKHAEHLCSYCAILDLSEMGNLEKSDRAILLYGPRLMKVFNEDLELLEPSYQISNQSFYLIERTGSTKKLNVINGNNERSYVEIIPIYSPTKNKIPTISFKEIYFQIKSSPQKKPNITFQVKKAKGQQAPTLSIKDSNLQSPLVVSSQGEEQSMSRQTSLIHLCPNGNKLLYPLHFHKRNLFLLGNRIESRGGQSYDCYGDSTQITFMPESFVFNWDLERNILMFTMLCGFVSGRKLFDSYFVYLGVNITLTALAGDSSLFLINFLILALAILLQKIIQLSMFLVLHLQDHIEMRYLRLMLLVPMAISILKETASGILDFNDVSAWKVLCLSLIFVVNENSITILLCKLYFHWESIIYNHNNIWELTIILLWLSQGLEAKPSPRRCKLHAEQNSDVRSLPYINSMLLGGFALFVGGPSTKLNHLLSLYIVCVTLARVARLNPRSK